MGDPAVSAYLPEHRGCSMKLDVVAGAAAAVCGLHCRGGAERRRGARRGDPTVEPVSLDTASALCCASSSNMVARLRRTGAGAGRGRKLVGIKLSAVRWTSPAPL